MKLPRLGSKSNPNILFEFNYILCYYIYKEKQIEKCFKKKYSIKDMLKDGKGTDFIILDVSFNPKIPEGYFSKNILKK